MHVVAFHKKQECARVKLPFGGCGLHNIVPQIRACHTYSDAPKSLNVP